jgi:hypothetical protein
MTACRAFQQYFKRMAVPPFSESMICYGSNLKEVSGWEISSFLKMEAVYSSETSAKFYRTANCHITEDNNSSKNHSYENLRWRLFKLLISRLMVNSIYEIGSQQPLQRKLHIWFSGFARDGTEYRLDISKNTKKWQKLQTFLSNLTLESCRYVYQFLSDTFL